MSVTGGDVLDVLYFLVCLCVRVLTFFSFSFFLLFSVGRQ